MYSIKKVVIGLDLTSLDETLIQYASMMVDILKTERAYLVHIAKEQHVPSDIHDEYPDLKKATTGHIKSDIQEKLDKFWTASSCETVIELIKGDPSEEFLHWGEIQQVDMIIMGHKKKSNGSGLLPNKLAKVAHACMLLVPETAKPRLTNILLPTDLSDFSKMAFDLGNQLVHNSEAKMVVQHVYTVPSGYSSTGKTYEEFTSIMRTNAQKDWQKFLHKHDIKDTYPIEFTLDDDRNPADKIVKEARAKDIDMILTGSHGRSSLASILLGSVVEKILMTDRETVLLIVKGKKENMSFLDALLKL